jgi:hypothetical protein
MNKLLWIAAGTLLLIGASEVRAQSKHDSCDVYARQAIASTPTSAGAARGAVGGAIFGNAGAVVGTACKSNQKAKSYQYDHDSCMSR